MSEPCYIGVDLGGTNVRAQALNHAGQPRGARFENSSHAQDSTEATLEAIAGTIRQAVAAAEGTVLGIGIAVPGHVDDETGIVRWAPNFGREVNGVFVSWRNVPLKQPLVDKLQLPVTMGNDANIAALGEYRYGSGNGSAKCLCMLTLGTGVGGGVVMSPYAVQGRASGPLLLIGGNCGGAELGHMVVLAGGADSTSGAYGTVEAYVGRDAIIRRAVHRIQRGYPSILRDMVEGDLSMITPLLITLAAEKGDRLARGVWEDVGQYLGSAIGTIINVFAPDVFAIGGQISKAGEYLLEPARESARNCAVPSLWEDVKIVTAELQDDAGILGGAALAAERFAVT